MLWLALLLPDLPLQVFTRGGVDTSLPLAVTAGHPRPHVVAASAPARAHGVEAGQSVAAALAVAPALVLRPRAPGLEVETLAEVASWAGAFSPRISLAPPDGVLLEIAASLKLFGGAETIAAALHEGLARLGLEAAIATAPTPLAARWFARIAPGTASPATPDWQARLDALPLSLLGDAEEVTPATLELLAGVGLRTLGELRALPGAGLARRQAGAVKHVLARARGDTPDPQPWFIPPAQYAQRIVLPVPVGDTEALAFVVRRLLAGLATWLAGRHAAVDRCLLELLHEDYPATLVEIVGGAPCQDEGRFTLLARERLARLELPAPVEEVRLIADAPVPFAPPPEDLFGHGRRARESALLLLDRLRARLGDDTVSLLETHADHRPEAAWSNKPPVAPMAPAAVREDSPAATPGRPVRPLWLLPAPQRLDPAAVTLIDGPERIEGGWWEQDDIRRDYYLARGPGSALWWVFQDLEPPGAWYVHGYFA